MASPTAEIALRERAVLISGGSVSAGPGLDGHVLAALRWARQYCGWHVWPQREEQLVVDGPGSQLLQLPSLHVVAVESVTEIPDWHAADPDADPTTLVERRDYSWSKSGMLRKRSGTWTREFRGITTNLTHGYATEEADDLLAVVAKAAVRGVGLAGGEISRVGAIAFQTVPGASSAGGSAFLGPEYAVLDHYRLNAEA